MQDADKAEVEYYYHSKKMDRVKASFIGSPLAIVRIFTSLLPVGPLFLTLITVGKSAFFELPSKLSIIQLYNILFGGDLNDFITAVKGASPEGMMLFGAIASLFLSALFLILHFAFLFLSCSKRGKLRNYLFSILTLLFAAAFFVLMLIIPENAHFAASFSIGSYLYLALAVINLVFEIVVFKKGIEIKHAQCYVGGIPIEEYFEMQKNGVPQEEIRAEMYRRLMAMQKEKEKELAEKAKKSNDEQKGGE